MDKFKKWSQLARGYFTRKHTLNFIQNNHHTLAKKFHTALLNSIHDKFNSEEWDAFNAIQTLRTRLLNDDRLIRFRIIGGAKDHMQLPEFEKRPLNDICSKATSPHKWGKLHFSIIRNTRPKNCLELGTNIGISGSYILSALKLNQSGKLVTLEGIEEFAQLAEDHFDELKLENYSVVPGNFQETLQSVLNTEHDNFDYVFIDGHHDEQATWDYYSMIRPKLAKSAVVIFDDIHWSTGMTRAWKKICSQSTSTLSVDLYRMGILLYDSEDREPGISLTLTL